MSATLENHARVQQQAEIERRQQEIQDQIAAGERDKRRSQWGFEADNRTLRWISWAHEAVPRQAVVHALARLSSRREMAYLQHPAWAAVYLWLRGQLSLDGLRTIGASAWAEWHRNRHGDDNAVWSYLASQLVNVADAAGGSAHAFLEELIDSGYFGHVGYIEREDAPGPLNARMLIPTICSLQLPPMLPFELEAIGPNPKMWIPLLPHDPSPEHYRVFAEQWLVIWGPCRELGSSKCHCIWIGDRSKDGLINVLFDYLLERGGEDQDSKMLKELLWRVEDHLQIDR
jgi:hypothetical protein